MGCVQWHAQHLRREVSIPEGGSGQRPPGPSRAAVRRETGCAPNTELRSWAGGDGSSRSYMGLSPHPVAALFPLPEKVLEAIDSTDLSGGAMLPRSLTWRTPRWEPSSRTEKLGFALVLTG